MENLSREEILKKIYYDINNPGSFGGIDNLLKEARKIDSNIRLKDVKEWLSGELVYTLHKKARRKFKRNPFIAEGPNENMQADLVDMREFVQDNDGFKYILTAIDIFSKKAFAVPVKNKNQQNVSDSMEKILEKYKPFKLMTDKGKEFENETFRELMKRFNIHHYTAKNTEIKCAIIERSNKTLKNKMFRYFTLKGKRRFMDILDDLIRAYNNTFHRSIKMTPNEVNDKNKATVFYNLYGFANKREYLRIMVKPKIPIEGTVRKKYPIKIFDRGYYTNWTDEIFKIYKSIPGKFKPYYKLVNEKGDIDTKRYYPEEIQSVKQNLFRIEKIVKERRFRKKKQFFVKWLNFPESYNSWIDAKELSKING